MVKKLEANVSKINVINTKIPNASGLASKTQYDSSSRVLKKRVKDLTKRYLILVVWLKIMIMMEKLLKLKKKKKTSISGLLSNTALKQKIADIKGKIPDISNLTTKAALNGIATEIEKKIPDNGKFITTPEFNNLTKLNFDDRMKEGAEKLGTKEKVNISINLGDKNKKKIERFQITDPNYFIGKSNFEDDSTQIY